MSTADEHRDLIAAYALGATDEADQSHIDALLDEHPDLRAELDEHRGLLASMAPVVEVEPTLAARLMDSLPDRSAPTLQLVAPDPTAAPSPLPLGAGGRGRSSDLAGPHRPRHRRRGGHLRGDRHRHRGGHQPRAGIGVGRAHRGGRGRRHRMTRAGRSQPQLASWSWTVA